MQQLVAFLSTPDACIHYLAKLTPVYPDGYELPLSYQHLKNASHIEELYLALENQPRVALACICTALAEVGGREVGTMVETAALYHGCAHAGCFWVSPGMAGCAPQKPPDNTRPPAAAACRLRCRLSKDHQANVQGQSCWYIVGGMLGGGCLRVCLFWGSGLYVYVPVCQYALHHTR